MAEDGPHFIQFGDAEPITPEAFSLHASALVYSFDYQTPGFIPDEYLENISAETTITALELETAGLWQRREGGYFINDPEAVSMLLSQRERADRTAAECLQRGHHLPDEEEAGWQTCTHCLAPLKRDDGKPVAGPNGEPPDYT